jgi:hypothetical protein
MNEAWILEVLTDLRKFADEQNLAKLTEHLDDAIHVATSEMKQQHKETVFAESHSEQIREFLRPAVIV